MRKNRTNFSSRKKKKIRLEEEAGDPTGKRKSHLFQNESEIHSLPVDAEPVRKKEPETFQNS
jgi:hypothetical protein